MADPLLTKVKPDAQILVAEDVSDSAGFFRVLMVSEGYEIHLSGEEALAPLASGTGVRPGALWI
ncbi:hypothetical protein DFAR_480004 [Desulfarculales bacterium]